MFKSCLYAAVAAAIPLLLTGPTGAEQLPKPFPEFEAKRVKPPKPGTGQRITVQITPPVVPPQTAAEGTPGASPEQPVGRYSWFWQQVAPDLDATTGAARLERALGVLSSSEGSSIAAPRLQTLQEIVASQGVPILMASLEARVSPALTLAVIAVESEGRVDALSSAGAQGLMQLMPDTASRFGVSDAFAAQQNIAGGVKYLDWLLQEFKGDAILALAGYNAGEGAVHDHAGVPPFAETRDYVPKVLAAYRVARNLCMTPPELITDGCVFRRVE
ncbi:lytic transglycosylase domain-containing protein [Phaeobacter sp. PT47_59]|uniref:lytic transglycosylase domain-containing protein n=1 Tax=Phaeobacter sp. PT47_59 TaxID=3029979 RepID=UPI0023804197|nr:lytic transglycosylase domain-containing protein [Phaeobacter sp. PT47_59]MDE4173284.1 lytic transglycosylase domain-containing protein [Phaeobacter sp. PT47_59]